MSRILALCEACGGRYAPRRKTSQYCSKHCSATALARRRFGDLTERFRRRVAAGGPDECWPWTGSSRKNGYGYLEVAGKKILAHRLAFRLATGAIDPLLLVCHSCDNRPCCNPAHLWQGTHGDNADDMASKGRGVKRQGSKHPLARLTESGVIEIRRMAAEGWRQVDIASLFGTKQAYVSTIVARKVWTHV